jgi:hypothetical protein
VHDFPIGLGHDTHEPAVGHPTPASPPTVLLPLPAKRRSKDHQHHVICRIRTLGLDDLPKVVGGSHAGILPEPPASPDAVATSCPKAPSEGTNLDKSVTTRDRDGDKGDQTGLKTALSDAHLKELAIALRTMQGSMSDPLTNGAWISPAYQAGGSPELLRGQ